jgi:hypothetical protein
VRLLIDGSPAGTTTANGDGSFSTPVTVPVSLGQHTVTAECGATLHSVLAVVLTSHAGPPQSTSALLLIIFLLLMLVLSWLVPKR